MKTSGWVIAVLLAGGGLMLQGCATSGGVNYAQDAAPAAQRSGSGNSDKAIVRADTKENFEAVVAAIHKQMEPGGRWQYIDPSERATIDSSFADMSKLYEQAGSVDKMDQAAKTRLLADQSTINAILTRKDGDRLICESRMPVGSHLPIKTCSTYAQIQAEQRATQRSMMQFEQQSQGQKKTVGTH